MIGPRRAGGLAALAALTIDQGFKLWMIFVYQVGERQPFTLTPFLDIRLAWNKGVSYSFLAADGPLGRWLLFAGALAAVSVLTVWLWTTPSRPTAIALGLMIGGALGNAVDRFAYGAVADFFHLRLDGLVPRPLAFLYDYVFNPADVAIVAAVAVLLYETMMPGTAARASKTP